MNQEQFLNRLAQITAADLHVYRESGRKRHWLNFRTDTHTPTVYGAANIATLMGVIRSDCHTLVIRFVIDKNGRPFFGEEGKVEGSTPGHEEMSNGLCRAAGTLTFSDNYQYIIGINHSSGFFKPQFSSLFWSLQYLFSHDSVFRIARKLRVDCNVDGLAQSITLDTKALREVIEQLSSQLADFSPDADHPFVTYSEEEPIIHVANGIPCSGSYNNLLPITQPPVTQPPATQPLVAQIGMFAPQHSISGIAAADEDYSLLIDLSSSEEEDDDLIISPHKKTKTA